MKKNKLEGSSFEDFLKDEDIYEESIAKALKKTSMYEFIKLVESKRGNKAKVRSALNSPSATERVLSDDPNVQYSTLIKAGISLGVAPVISWVSLDKLKLD